nr:hypothetical protein [uncultured Actinoplanes sp.]
MATTDHRAALRSLPALLALLVALFIAPHATAPVAAGSSARPGVSCCVVADAGTPAAEATTETPARGAEVAAVAEVADHTRVLATQRIAGPSGSRAPPAALL